ncbi:aminoacyl-tRNA hydrolase [Candidatus Woesebacteria bacterium]|jgi:PTH1 family peptidyl-tRNA hydrolase|nr:aminoacyl-tRNA hydrolase [Candidatus Woesebacteria bacterium]
MKLIVGLGNPGEKYIGTRHNVGFDAVDKLARELGSSTISWQFEKKHNALVAKVGEVILVKPQTFMNESGKAVSGLTSFYKLTAQDVWVIHDDLDLPMGKIRIRIGGASAGHHGVDSIIEHLKTDGFLRFRLGIGTGKENIGSHTDRKLSRSKVIDFVLSRFQSSEAGAMKHLIKHSVEAVRIAMFEGIDRAMNRFN